MPRAIKSATISFGLVSVPVKLYAATEAKKFEMHMHHSADGGRSVKRNGARFAIRK